MGAVQRSTASVRRCVPLRLLAAEPGRWAHVSRERHTASAWEDCEADAVSSCSQLLLIAQRHISQRAPQSLSQAGWSVMADSSSRLALRSRCSQCWSSPLNTHTRWLAVAQLYHGTMRHVSCNGSLPASTHCHVVQASHW
jgi:hypothetical protein